MKPNIQALLEMCIDEGLSAAMYGSAVELTADQMSVIRKKVRTEIWLQLDTYFTFTDNDND
jgi:hypothetical protein